MKKPNNYHGKQFSKLVKSIRLLIKKFAHHHTPLTYLLSPGLASLFSENNDKPLELPLTFKEIFSKETYKIQNKYKNINLYEMYWQIRKEDINNFSINNYSIDPRDASYIDEK